MLLALLLAAAAWGLVKANQEAPPTRRSMAQAINLVRALVDGEYVATTHRVNFGEWGRRLTVEADLHDFSDAVGVRSRPDGDPPFAWLVGLEPSFSLDVLEPTDRRLALRLGGFLGRNQTVTVRFNGHDLGSTKLRKDGESQMVRADVPAGIQVRGRNTVTLVMGEVQSLQLTGEPVPLPISGVLLGAHFLLPGEPEGVPGSKPKPSRTGVEKELRPGRETRVVVLEPGISVRVGMRLPATSRALLHFSVERLDVPLELSLVQDDGRRIVLARLDTRDPLPRDVRQDLTRWVGQPIRLDLWAYDGKGQVELSELQVLAPDDELVAMGWVDPDDRADDTGAAGSGAAESLSAVADAVTSAARRVPSVAPDGRRWSFLVVVLDAFARGRSSAFGGALPTTPILEQLVTRGLLPTRASAPASYTLASVGSLLTGLHPLSHGVLEHGGEGRLVTLADDAPRLALQLAAAGWRTGAWLTNTNTSGEHGYRQGFDHWEQLFDDAALWENGVDGGQLPPRLASFLADAGDQPFLAYTHVFEPHAPWTAPEQDRALFVEPYTGPVSGERAWIDSFRFGEIDLGPADWRHLEQLYAARMHQADRVLGALLATLEASGRAADTILLVTSDHGEALGEHGLLEHSDHVYGEQVDVPFVMVVPGGPRGPLVGTATLVDIAPTLLGLAGLPVPADMQGVDLLRGEGPGERPLLACSYGRRPQFSWTRWPWRLVVDTDTRRRQLFDLEHDPHEQHDLSAQRPATFAWLYRELTRDVIERVEHRSAPVVIDAADAERIQQLKEMGYTVGDLPAADEQQPADDPLVTILRSLLQRG